MTPRLAPVPAYALYTLLGVSTAACIAFLASVAAWLEHRLN